MWQAAAGQETALASTEDRMLPKMDKRDQGKLTGKPCKERIKKSFIIPASQKSLSVILGQKAEDDALKLQGKFYEILQQPTMSVFIQSWKLLVCISYSGSKYCKYSFSGV